MRKGRSFISRTRILSVYGKWIFLTRQTNGKGVFRILFNMAASEEDDCPQLVPLSIDKNKESKDTETDASRSKVPVTIITGFLGNNVKGWAKTKLCINGIVRSW